MKTSTASAITIALAGIVILSSVQGVESNTGYPSQLLRDENKPLKLSAWFIIGPNSDLRWLFSRPGDTEERIGRKVAIFDLEGLTMGKETGKVQSREVVIEKPMKVRDFLDEIKLGKWEGGSPQLRIIKQNQIIQSPAGTLTAEEQADLTKFMQTVIEPGDIVVAARIE